MKLFFSLLLIIISFNSVFFIIPEWDLAGSGIELELDKNYEVQSGNFYSAVWSFQKRITTNSSGYLVIENYASMQDSDPKQVDFDYVESCYTGILGNLNIICPRGAHQPFDFNNKKEITINTDGKSIFEGGENWDLSCYLYTSSPNYFLTFYARNGKYNNAYLTFKDNYKGWYAGAKIDKNDLYELFDYRLNYNAADSNNHYNMLALLKKSDNLILSKVQYTLGNGDGNQYAELDTDTSKNVIEMKTYTQAQFLKSGSFKFYFMTYNSISDFLSGYTTSYPSSYVDLSFNLKKNENNQDFEFYEDVEIEEMNFLLNNKFLYYKMKVIDSEKRYYGIFDIELNKIIFNTGEEITKFVPLNVTAMIALTKDKAYEICLYKDSNNNCVDSCDNGYYLDISGNKCGGSCASNRYKLLPNNICVDTCNTTLFYSNSSRHCGLCKDFDSNMKYKFEEGTECLSGIPTGAVISNTKFNLLKCDKGYTYENNACKKDCYELCEECEEPSSEESDQKCISCIDPNLFDIDKGNCYCKNGYEISETTCNICINACKTYVKNSCNCEECYAGYFINSNTKCEKCTETVECKTYVNNTCNCKECDAGYFINSNTKCEKCTDSVECNTYVENSCNCIDCKEKNFLNNENKCEKCSNDCENCTSTADKCTSCAINKFLDNNKCYDCSDKSYCKTTIDNTCKCEECNEGYYKDFYTCKECIVGCKSCDNKDTCKECTEEYFIKDKKCIECSNNCKDKVGDTCECASCNDNYFLENGQCFECSTGESCIDHEDNGCKCIKCKDGFYIENYNCKNCSENCLTCDGGIVGDDHHCTNCSESMYLVNVKDRHICVENCSDYNYTLNKETNMCEIPKNNKGGNNNNNVDYMLWIFVGIIGILLIVISICICKKCCSNSKSEEDLMNDTNELDEKELIN